VAQFGRFLVVGASATLLHYVILVLLHGRLAVDANASTAVGYGLSATYNFFASYYFTYRSRVPLLIALPRYAFVVVTGLLLNGALFSAARALLGVHYLIAQLFATAVVLLWSFCLGRSFAFKAMAG
jgi:putative flippase GtrA